ncbi:MAG: hypothetical protein AABY22_36715 [Nanoarchaeota archaeon]
MKTRIKIIEKNDGSKRYVCQEKGLRVTSKKEVAYLISLPFLWPIILIIHYRYSDINDSFEYASIEEAQKFINDRIENFNAENKIRLAKKTKSITYLKYP